MRAVAQFGAAALFNLTLAPRDLSAGRPPHFPIIVCTPRRFGGSHNCCIVRRSEAADVLGHLPGKGLDGLRQVTHVGAKFVGLPLVEGCAVKPDYAMSRPPDPGERPRERRYDLSLPDDPMIAIVVLASIAKLAPLMMAVSARVQNEFSTLRAPLGSGRRVAAGDSGSDWNKSSRRERAARVPMSQFARACSTHHAGRHDHHGACARPVSRSAFCPRQVGRM